MFSAGVGSEDPPMLPTDPATSANALNTLEAVKKLSFATDPRSILEDPAATDMAKPTAAIVPMKPNFII
jgi:hypothetical protein